MRIASWFFSAAALLVVLLGGGVVEAQDRVAELAQSLRSAEDFRVRTQAALALGASDDQRAVEALCAGLSDANTTVRAASASALGRLAKGGKECLSDRLKVEPSEDVKGVLTRALARLKEKEGGGVDGNTRYYVAIGDATNKSSRSNASVNAELRKHFAKALSKQSGFVLAPASETPEQALELKRRFPQLKTIFLWPKYEASYAGRTLVLRLELSLFSYPDKAYLGSLSSKLSMPDTAEGDTSSENELIEMASEALTPDLARTAAKL